MGVTYSSGGHGVTNLYFIKLEAMTQEYIFATVSI